MVILDTPPPAYNESSSQLGLTLTADPSGKNILITVKPPATPATAVIKQEDEEKEQLKAKCVPGNSVLTTAVIKQEEDEEKEQLKVKRAPMDFVLTTAVVKQEDDEEKEQLKAKRAPVDFVLTIDVSGSMASEAPVPGENERTGLSVLDVVKHAANTIITTMKPEDRIAIVSFTGMAKVVLPLTHTNEEGKAKALNEVESLRPLDSTNLWDGLKQSMNILTGAPQAPKRRLSSIFLLTDGLPNVEPPRGHIPMLRLYLESQPKDKTKFTINTFGFGYSLDSKLLNDIAKIGNGHFGFIADSGVIGTNFVHAVANTYATYAEGLFVDIEVDDSQVVKGMEVLGSFEVNKASWGVQVPLGQLQYGQTRDVVIRLPKSLSKSPVTVTARCRPWDSDDEVKTTRVISDAHLPPSESAIDPALLYQSLRLEFVSTVNKLVAASGGNSRGGYVRTYAVPPNATTAFKDLVSRIQAAYPGESPVEPSVASDALDLGEDISGQVLLGIADIGTFNKWGLHYLLSLSRSHQRQQCGNFKDPGLQPYGRDSVLFKTTRDEIDVTFDDLPAPKPSLSVNSYSGIIPPPLLGGAPTPVMTYAMQMARLQQLQQQAQQPAQQQLQQQASLQARLQLHQQAQQQAQQQQVQPAQQQAQLRFQQQARQQLASSSPTSPRFSPYSRVHSPSSAAYSPASAAYGSSSAALNQSAPAPSAPSARVSMKKYNSRSAPCFAESSIVELSDGEKVAVEHLLVGSSVKTPLGSAKVTGIVRTSSPDGSFDLCKLGDGLLITPWHPVYVSEEGTWRFPVDLVAPRQTACSSVYSLILEENQDSDGHAVFIGGIRCVTMGHGVVDPADVRSHPFLANHFSVMQALKAHPGFAERPTDAVGTIKDTETDLMCGFVWKQDPERSLNALPEVPSVLLDIEARSLTVKA